jgi:hypothetical protein
MNGFVVVYLDDILTFGKTRGEHERHLRDILKILRREQLIAKLSKCSFFQTEILFLGHIINEHGVTVDPTKIQDVQIWPEPNSVKDYLVGTIKPFMLIACNHFWALLLTSCY